MKRGLCVGLIDVVWTTYGQPIPVRAAEGEVRLSHRAVPRAKSTPRMSC